MRVPNTSRGAAGITTKGRMVMVWFGDILALRLFTGFNRQVSVESQAFSGGEQMLSFLSMGRIRASAMSDCLPNPFRDGCRTRKHPRHCV